MLSSTIPLFARTLRGLEWIAAGEIAALPGAVVQKVEHRGIRFNLPNLNSAVMTLGMVDDVFLDCGSGLGIDRTRASLAIMADLATTLNIEKPLHHLAALRPLPQYPAFDVVAGFLGKRNYNRFEIEDALGTVLAQRLNGTYHSHREPTPATDLTWRVQLEADGLSLGLRLGTTPLHRRIYRQWTRQGSLHPPLARAMALLAGLRPGLKLLDPCCGAGTILLEAGKAQPQLFLAGNDFDDASLTKAVRNAADADLVLQLTQGDTTALPYADGTIDRIVSNIPWGQAVAMSGDMAINHARLWQEIARILAPNGRAVILTGEAVIPKLFDEANLRTVLQTKIAVAGIWGTLYILKHADDVEFDVFDRQSQLADLFEATYAQYRQE